MKTFPADISKLGNVEDNHVAKETVYDKWVTKVYSIKIPSTTGPVFKTLDDPDKQNLEKKIEDVDKMIPNTG